MNLSLIDLFENAWSVDSHMRKNHNHNVVNLLCSCSKPAVLALFEQEAAIDAVERFCDCA